METARFIGEPIVGARAGSEFAVEQPLVLEAGELADCPGALGVVEVRIDHEADAGGGLAGGLVAPGGERREEGRDALEPAQGLDHLAVVDEGADDGGPAHGGWIAERGEDLGAGGLVGGADDGRERAPGELGLVAAPAVAPEARARPGDAVEIRAEGVGGAAVVVGERIGGETGGAGVEQFAEKALVAAGVRRV